MEGFLQTALSFPTVLFSFLLILAIIYWGIVALGMVEIDVLDLDAESVVDGAGQAEGLAALLAKLKLNGVPVTLVLTLLSFFAWFLCYFVQLWLLSALPLGWLRYPLGAVVAVGALFLAAPLAATLCRPLRRCSASWKAPAASRCWARSRWCAAGGSPCNMARRCWKTAAPG